LQVFVSILGLVLVKEPFYNEAGFDVRAGDVDAVVPAAFYSERTYFRSRSFITRALSTSINSFDDVVKWLYVSDGYGAPMLLDRAVKALKEIVADAEKGEVNRGALKTVSKGALVMMKRQLEVLESARAKRLLP
jgi:ubiquitin-conjugating enzyme E2 O